MPHNQGLFRKAEAALLEEKANKLFGLIRILDARLPGDFRSLLPAEPLSREVAVGHLNGVLAPLADEIAAAFPGVGVGYYASCVDGIVVYAPSQEFGDKVGIAVASDHIGRRAMRERRGIVGVGSMVRGDIMNCVRPLVRQGEIIGFAWANETVEDIYHQLQHGEQGLYYTGENLESLLGITGLLVLSSRQYTHIRRLLQARTPSLQAPQAVTLNLLETFATTQRYIEMFLHTLDAGIIIQQAGGETVFVNRSARALLQETGIDDRWSVEEIFIHLGLPHLPVEIRRMREQGRRHRRLPLQVRNPAGSGSPREIDLHIAFLDDGGGYLLYILEDMHRIRQQEEYQWRATKLAAAGEVAVAVAHEIRNPLAIIRGALRLVPDRLHDHQFLLRLAEVLQQEVAHIDDTIDSLLSFTRVAEPRFATVNLNSVLEGVVRLIEPYATGSGIDVVAELPEEALLIEGDARYLQQALLNLMLNAVQAMTAPGRVYLRCRHRPGSNLVEVMVQDTGPGIPEEEQGRIFDMFYSRRPGGAGLGLALVQRIIDEHQGFIRLESEVGKGTTFTITLPVKRYSRQRPGGRDNEWPGDSPS